MSHLAEILYVTKIMILILSLFGNSLNVIVYLKYPKLRTFYFKLVIYLSILDITMGIVRLFSTEKMVSYPLFCTFHVNNITHKFS